MPNSQDTGVAPLLCYTLNTVKIKMISQVLYKSMLRPLLLAFLRDAKPLSYKLLVYAMANTI